MGNSVRLRGGHRRACAAVRWSANSSTLCITIQCSQVRCVVVVCNCQFWNIDHIVAVSDGGGQCDVDNLRTLCTVCHRQVTARQSKARARQRSISASSKCGSITNFFRPLRT